MKFLITVKLKSLESFMNLPLNNVKKTTRSMFIATVKIIWRTKLQSLFQEVKKLHFHTYTSLKNKILLTTLFSVRLNVPSGVFTMCLQLPCAVSKGSTVLFPKAALCCVKRQHCAVSKGSTVLCQKAALCCFQRQHCAVSKGSTVLFPKAALCCVQRQHCAVSKGSTVLCPKDCAVFKGSTVLCLKAALCCVQW